MRNPQYSVLISAFNEGESLRRTIDDLFTHAPESPFEIIVVDDGSIDGSTDFLRDTTYRQRPIRLARNEARRGLIFGRARAADLAAGEYLCVLDAHCCVTPGWLEHLAARLDAVDGQGLVVPRIHELDAGGWTINYTSSAPGDGCTISGPLLDFSWSDPKTLDGLLCTPTIAGGAWMCTREWYAHIGGLDRGMRFWGGENIDISLRTWVMGGWCLVAPEVVIGHLFKSGKKIKRPAHDSDIGVGLAFNKIRAAHNVFEPATMQRVIRNLRRIPGFVKALDLIRDDAETIARLKEHVESRRTRSDDWLFTRLDLPVLDAPFFHRRRQRAPGRAPAVRRPRVSIVVSGGADPERLRDLVASVRERTTYRRFEIIALQKTSTPDSSTALDGLRSETPAVRLLHVPSDLGGGLAENMAALASQGEYLVFLTDDAEIVADHWLERFLLLFEQRPRLLMASPRLVTKRSEGHEDSPAHESVFDVVWDWNSPTFGRERRATPLAQHPYQALSSPDTCCVVHRERFLELGGFDRTVREGPRPTLDLAIHGWLAGYEILCHPLVQFRRRDDGPNDAGAEDGESGRPAKSDESGLAWRDYTRSLPALKFFTNPARLEACRQRSPRAEKLVRENAAYLDRRRRQFLGYGRFDDDWLFYKFQLQDVPAEDEDHEPIGSD